VPALDAGHLIELLIAAITFFGISWGFHREDKRDRQRKAEEAEELQERRHADNRRVIEDLTIQIKYYPLHSHDEQCGPLTSEGIRPRLRFRGD